MATEGTDRLYLAINAIPLMLLPLDLKRSQMKALYRKILKELLAVKVYSNLVSGEANPKAIEHLKEEGYLHDDGAVDYQYTIDRAYSGFFNWVPIEERTDFDRVKNQMMNQDNFYFDSYMRFFDYVCTHFYMEMNLREFRSEAFDSIFEVGLGLSDSWS